MDLARWLRELGLHQYEQAFRDNGVDSEILQSLTGDDLKEIGVVAVGHRRKLLNAIAQLNSDTLPSFERDAANVPAPIAKDYGLSLSTPASAERRHLTVMFCDLAGSTELARRLDPEDYRTLLAAYHGACFDAISTVEGFIAKYMGDGVLAYFGYPNAHEDDGIRAVTAALAVIGAVSQLRPLEQAVQLRARIGIATGLVVVGDLIGSGSSREQSVAGETPNLAARLQTVAPLDGVLVSEATRRLLGSEFELDDFGTHPIKGFDDPVPTWRVIKHAGIHNRFEARGGARSSLIGRGEEIDLLLHRWNQVREGEGQAIYLTGEAGIGKSRVAHGLLDLVRVEAERFIQLQCSPHAAGTTLRPVIEQIERSAGFTAEDTPVTKLQKIERILPEECTDQTRWFLAALLTVQVGDRYEIPQHDPRRHHELTIEAVIDYLVQPSGDGPTAVLVEDVHWADPSTLEMLGLLVDRMAENRHLLIVTARPGLALGWHSRSNVTLMSLNHLTRRQSYELIQSIAGSEALPADLVDVVVARADGIPLYVEELTKAILEARPDRAASSSTSSSTPVPATLHDSLMARLDRHPKARTVAQAAAVIGREFSYSLLRGIVSSSEPQFEASLEQLVSSELVFVRGKPPHATYVFKHALVRDAAYESLLKLRRQELHGQLATLIEDSDPDSVARQPELLAFHFDQARQGERALLYWERAADGAAARQAHQEAIRHCEHGLTSTRLIPDLELRNRHELRLQVRLGNSAIAAKGWSAPEVGEAFYRARALCAELHDDQLLQAILVGLFYFHSFQAQLHPAEALGLELLALGEKNRDRILETGAHKILVDVRYKLADFETARHHLEAGFRLYEQSPWPQLTVDFLDDPGPNLLIYGSVVLWILGYPEKAAQTAKDAVALARRGGHRLSIAHTVYMVGHLAELAGDWEEVQRSNDETARLADEWGLMGLRQQVVRRQRLVSVALDTHQEQLEYKLQNPQPGFARSLHDAVSAQALSRLNRVQEALQLIDAAVQWSEDTSSLFFLAELHRIRADFLARSGQVAAAERALATAIDIARRQGAKMWELRAACDLARLLAERGRQREARELLAPLYGSFTEGFDHTDLCSAHRLLQGFSMER